MANHNSESTVNRNDKKSVLACAALNIVLQHSMAKSLLWDIEGIPARQADLRRKMVECNVHLKSPTEEVFSGQNQGSKQQQQLIDGGSYENV
jgi:hypothetical protein